jgi:hypothetical protein
MKLAFIELPKFTRQVAEYLDDDEYQAFQVDLIKNPERGDLIQGCHGLRKARIAFAGRGKSGSGRVMYLFLPEPQVIFLFYMFRKSDAENIDKAQRNQLGQFARQIKEAYSNEKRITQI